MSKDERIALAAVVLGVDKYDLADDVHVPSVHPLAAPTGEAK
jgi:hypothetical protein